MEYSTEIINISKIEDGFFVGDKFCASNIDVVIQFKITHMINASGSQILNQFEALGVKYLTLDWQENPNQTLFDIKDEIQDKIISFIDESFTRGEGLLVYSVKGINRALIIVVIYFMKKFCWSLKKCLEFIEIKVKDGKIKKYFLSQLQGYEKRIKRALSKDWYNLNIIKNEEELMIRNTYLNSLLKIQKVNNINAQGNINKYQYKNRYNIKPHVCWGNINYENKDDLLLKKNIKDIDSHILLKPKKKSIKLENSEKENMGLNLRTNSKQNISNNIVKDNMDLSLENNIKNLMNLGLNMKIVNKINQISNNFNNLNMPKQRPNSAEQKKHKNFESKTQDIRKYDQDKLSNYFDNLEKKEKEKIVQNKNYKKLILKNRNENNKFNKNNNSNNNLDNNNNNQRKKPTSYDKNNNKKDIININRQYIYPNKIINNSININMINYITNNNSQQMPFFPKNNFFNKRDDNFNINDSYDPYNFFNKEENSMYNPQNPNKIKNKMGPKNFAKKMNNSANNFYTFNSQKNKEKFDNDYYNVMGQSFHLNSNKDKDKNINKKVSIFLRTNKSTNDIKKNPYFYKINKNNRNFNLANSKNLKRASTPNNLLPKRNYHQNINESDNIEPKNQINYINYSSIKLDDSNSMNFNDVSFNNKSFILNQKNPRNQCKFISLLKYIIFISSFRLLCFK